MKHFRFYTFLITLIFNTTLIHSSHPKFRLPTLQERQQLQERNPENTTTAIQDFHAYHTEYSRLHKERQCATVWTSLCVTLATIFGYETFSNEDPSCCIPCFSLLFLYFTARNFTILQTAQDDQKKIIEQCAQEFTKEELETLKIQFQQLNPRNAMDPRSLLFLTQRKQWQIENKQK